MIDDLDLSRLAAYRLAVWAGYYNEGDDEPIPSFVKAEQESTPKRWPCGCDACRINTGTWPNDCG